MRLVCSLVVLALALGACSKQHSPEAHPGEDEDPAPNQTSDEATDPPAAAPHTDATTRLDAASARDAKPTSREATPARPPGVVEPDRSVPPESCDPRVLTLLGAAGSCKYQLGATSFPAAVYVELDGVRLARDTADGWTLSDMQVVLRGKACDRVNDGKPHALSASEGCN